MTIRQFLNSQKKKFDNDIKVIINEIMKAYNINNRTYKTNKKYVIIPKIRYILK